MKVKTILKSIGFFIGCVLCFQLISAGTYLMNQPSNVLFTLGILLVIAIAMGTVLFGFMLGVTLDNLLTEYTDSKKAKLKEKLNQTNQDKKEKD